jgi:hypothetical protein
LTMYPVGYRFDRGLTKGNSLGRVPGRTGSTGS